MKLYLALLLLFVAFTRCTKEELPSSGRSSLNQEVEIKLNETLDLSEATASKATTAKVRVHLAGLTDSRCPSNANCIRYGSAVARLWLVQNDERSPTVELTIGEALPTDTRKPRLRSADTTLVKIANTEYQVILKSVLPYPCVGCPDQQEPSAGIVIQTR